MVSLDVFFLVMETRPSRAKARDRSRTDDLPLTKGVLYRLSYTGVSALQVRSVTETPKPSQLQQLLEGEGFEPP